MIKIFLSVIYIDLKKKLEHVQNNPYNIKMYCTLLFFLQHASL